MRHMLGVEVKWRFFGEKHVNNNRSAGYLNFEVAREDPPKYLVCIALEIEDSVIKQR